MYELGDGVNVGATLGFDRSTGDFSLVPLMRAAWTVDTKWRVEALLPKAAEVSHRANKWFRAGMKSELDFSRFHLDQASYGVEDLYLEYFAIKAGPTLNVSPVKFLHIDLHAGYAFLRRISATIDDGQPGINLYVNAEPAARQIDLAPAPFLAVRLWMGLDGEPQSAQTKVN
ncbi:MAG: hypothetical protein H6718_11745 [Polyangiaceae bacterium]|nr:hypothetical protein [Polyangiaceae bacterium]